MTKFKSLSRSEQLLFASSFLMLFMLVIRDQFISPLILLFFITSIPFWKGKTQKQGRTLVFTLIGFYILHVISLAYTENWVYAGSDLMTKLSYLIFPVFILLIRSGYSLILSGIKWGLIVGSAVSMVFSLIRALILGGGLSGEAFMPSNYALNMHTSYLSLILLISTIFLWTTRISIKGEFLIKLAYTTLVLASIFFLRSLGVFVCIAAILGAYPLWKAVRDRKWIWLLALPLYGLIFFMGVKSSAKIENDVTTSFQKLGEWSASPEDFLLENKNSPESSTVRLVTWTFSARIIDDHPFGTGIGDVKDVLDFAYRSYGYTYYAYHQLNPHNQFLQTGIAIGWQGILTLLAVFVMMLVYAYRNRSVALFLITTTILVSCLFESMLERQVGVILTSVMVLYLIFLMRNLTNQKLSK